eukprot:1394382-Amorphochlora_amoeboformis.AAC.2
MRSEVITWPLYALCMSFYDVASVVSYTRHKVDFANRCIVYDYGGILFYIRFLAGSLAIVCTVVEWVVHNGVRRIKVSKIYWCCWVLAVLLDIASAAVGGIAAPFSLVFLLVFGVDNSILSAGRFRIAWYLLCSLTIGILYINLLIIDNACSEDTFALVVMNSSKLSLVSYATVKQVELCYLRYRYPSVRILTNLKDTIEEALGRICTDTSDRKEEARVVASLRLKSPQPSDTGSPKMTMSSIEEDPHHAELQLVRENGHR